MREYLLDKKVGDYTKDELIEFVKDFDDDVHLSDDNRIGSKVAVRLAITDWCHHNKNESISPGTLNMLVNYGERNNPEWQKDKVIVDGWTYKNDLIVPDCPFCHGIHTHGHGDGLDMSVRVSHCHEGEYWIKIRRELTANEHRSILWYKKKGIRYSKIKTLIDPGAIVEIGKKSLERSINKRKKSLMKQLEEADSKYMKSIHAKYLERFDQLVERKESSGFNEYILKKYGNKGKRDLDMYVGLDEFDILLGIKDLEELDEDDKKFLNGLQLQRVENGNRRLVQSVAELLTK